jgi:hypothetical protein
VAVARATSSSPSRQHKRRRWVLLGWQGTRFGKAQPTG